MRQYNREKERKEKHLTADVRVPLQLLSQLCPQIVHAYALVPKAFAVIIRFLLQKRSAGIHGVSPAVPLAPPAFDCLLLCPVPTQVQEKLPR